ncbi:MAG: hypothetical protein ABUK01_08045 [Leptospirales bacterium]
MKIKIIQVFLAISFLFPLSLWPVSLPEGIRGVTQTYGPWLENLLENSPLKKLFPDDNNRDYREYQRLLFIAERQIEDYKPKEALSSIKKARFLLDDIVREVQLKYEWNSVEEKIETISELPKEESIALATFLSQKTYLLLQYEYYHYNYGTDFTKSKKYFNKAMNLLKQIPEDSYVHQQLKKTDLFSYLKLLEKIYNIKYKTVEIYIQKLASVLKKKTRKEKNLKDSWNQRIYKRSILFYSSTGYFNEASLLLKIIDKFDPEIIPESIRISILINRGELSSVLQTLDNRLKEIDLKEQSQWGLYIVTANRYWNTLFIQNDFNQLLAFTKEYSKQISHILDTYYLKTDIFDFLENEKLKFNLRIAFLNNRFTENSTMEQAKDLYKDLYGNIQTPEKISPESRYNLSVLKSISEGVAVDQNSKPAIIYFHFRKAIVEKNWKSATHLKSLLQKSTAASSFKTSSKLAFAVRNPAYKTTEENWFAIWSAAIQDASFAPPKSFLYTEIITPKVDYNSLFSEFISTKGKSFSVDFKLRLLRLIDFYKNWENRIKYPPIYFNAKDNRVRYDYLANFEFALPQNKLLNLVQPKLKHLEDVCPEQTICWAVLPVKNEFYSLVWMNSKKPVTMYEGFTTEKKDVVNMLDTFYKKLETDSEPENATSELHKISSVFEKPLTVVANRAQKNSLPIKLYLFQNAHIVPFETLILKDGAYLSQRFRVTRKMPTDLLTYFNHCMDECVDHDEVESKNHFLIGVGTRKGRFIFGTSEKGDEVLEVENLFAEKALIYDGSNLAKEIIAALKMSKNRILHMAGEWNAEPNNPSLLIRGKKEDFRLGQIRAKNKLPYVIVSMQRVNTFNMTNYIWLTDILETFRYHDTNILIISLAPTPKIFRQAFFYNMYYRLEQKGENWYTAFRSSLIRTQKGFTHHVWPFLMVLYEK